MIRESEIRISLKDFKYTSCFDNLFNANFAGNSQREYRVQYNGNIFKIHQFTHVLAIEVAIKTSVVFSVNLPDKIALINNKSGMVSGKNIYIDTDNAEKSQECARLIEDCIKLLDFDVQEGLIVYRNSLCLAIHNLSKLSQFLILASKIKTIIERNFPDEMEDIDISRIPRTLRSLSPLLKKWATSDDEMRQGKIKSASTEELKQIASKIHSKTNEINAYLDSFCGQPLTYEATLLGNLSELADEISNCRIRH